MSKRKVIIISGILVIVGVIALFLYENFFGPLQQSLSIQPPLSTVNIYSETYKEYNKLYGDEYDRRFIIDMKANYQGAVDISALAEENASHVELKEMAKSIISSHEKTIVDMNFWQDAWGYSTEKHEADGNCVKEIPGMSNTTILSDENRNEGYDRDFLQRMIIHHQTAIDMAGPASTNAKREEVKNLAEQTISKYSEQIEQFKRWRVEWNYNK